MKSSNLLLPSLILSLFLTNCTKKENPSAQSDTAQGQVSKEAQVKRGEYLVTVIGCNDCHSPKIMTEYGPAPDPERLLSGHPADEKMADVADKSVLKNYALFNMSLSASVGPWGTSFAANLTPDGTGIGNWSLNQFKKAMREGKFKGMENGRMLLPPMPWPNFKAMNNEDLEAIWAYLNSIPAVRNIVPAPVPPAG